MVNDLWRNWFVAEEAEKLPPERYRQLREQALIRRGDAVWFIPLLWAVGCAAMWLAIARVLAILILAAQNAAAAAAPVAGPPVPTSLGYVWTLSNLLAAGLLGAAVFLSVRWFLIVRSMRRLGNKCVCPYCEFSLIGLAVKQDRVQCPECGESVRLSEHGLFAEDLMTESQRAHKPEFAGRMGAYLTDSDKQPGRHGLARPEHRRERTRA